MHMPPVAVITQVSVEIKNHTARVVKSQSTEGILQLLETELAQGLAEGTWVASNASPSTEAPLPLQAATTAGVRVSVHLKEAALPGPSPSVAALLWLPVRIMVSTPLLWALSAQETTAMR